MLSFYEKLQLTTQKNGSYLCVGLDLDLKKLPENYQKYKEPLYQYGCEIIDQTKDHVNSYKPNIAFFEDAGPAGIEQLKKLIDYIPQEIPVILDCKRGDIGNTAAMYASSAYDFFKADAVTLSPYMGLDSVQPFLQYKGKFCFILIRTSNPSSNEIQNIVLKDGNKLYQKVAQITSSWADQKSIGFVVGATQTEELKDLRTHFPENIFLIPGIGSQGGDIDETMKYGLTKKDQLAIINVSRKIIYPIENTRGQVLKFKFSLSAHEKTERLSQTN